MIQTEVRHPPGTFAACSECQREPHHIETRGRTINESQDLACATPSLRHSLECCRCGRTTAKHARLPDAIDEWGAAYAQGELEFPRRRQRAA